MSSIPEQVPTLIEENTNNSSIFYIVSREEGEEAAGSGADSIEIQEYRYTDKINKLLTQIPGLSYKLKKPVPVTIEPEEDFYYVHNDELDINEGGASPETALDEFYTFFVNDFENWLNSSDKELSEDAKELKAKYLDYVDIQ